MVAKAMNDLGYDNFHVHDARHQFLDALTDIYDPEQKRKII